MLAYSSVAHAGYMLAALAALGSGLADSGTQDMLQMAIVFHLAVLVLFKLGAFLVLTLIEIDGGGNKISDLNGLARRDPIIATSMFVFMLSLAGIPPLSGFLSKVPHDQRPHNYNKRNRRPRCRWYHPMVAVSRSVLPPRYRNCPK